MNYIAVYQGKIYDASLISDEEVIVRTSEKSSGFYEKPVPDGGKIYIKHLSRKDLQEFYKEKKFGTWHHMEFEIDGETAEEYTIWYTYHDYKKEEAEIQSCIFYGMERYDRNVFYKSVPKSEISKLRIEKINLLK